MFTLIFGLFLVSGWLWVAWKGCDAWPFSAYPMFSEFPVSDQVNVFRLQLERENGEVLWWNPPVRQLARNFDQGFRRSLKKSIAGEGESPTEFVGQFMDLWVDDQRELSAVAVIGRSVLEAKGEWQAVDQEIFRLNFGSVPG